MASSYMIDWIDEDRAASGADFGERHHALDENGLVEAAMRGQDAAFDKLLSFHSKKIFRSIYRVTRNREDAEDALQDTFLKAFVHIKNFDSRSKFSTWLTRIAINSALTIVRKKRSAAAHSSITSDADGNFDLAAIPDRAPNPEAEYAQQQRKAIVRNAIRTLPSTIRQAVVMQRLQGLSMMETAEKLGLSLAAAKSRLFRAKAALRKSLNPNYL
jgi:RNA polymerase sigma factor (sigma-70 family)